MFDSVLNTTLQPSLFLYFPKFKKPISCQIQYQCSHHGSELWKWILSRSSPRITSGGLLLVEIFITLNGLFCTLINVTVYLCNFPQSDFQTISFSSCLASTFVLPKILRKFLTCCYSGFGKNRCLVNMRSVRSYCFYILLLYSNKQISLWIKSFPDYIFQTSIPTSLFRFPKP